MEAELAAVCARIAPSSADWAARARARLDTLTKPQGSLGRLEDVAAQWVAIRQGRAAERLCKAAYVFAADHGVAIEGVSAYPREVTHQMVLNFLAGGAAVNVLVRLHGATLHVVDVGVDADIGDATGLIHRKVMRGTANMVLEPAMTEDAVQRALAVGVEQADAAAAAGVNLIALGEMGIGNTTSAAAVTCALTGARAEEATGRGTGVDDMARARKVEVIRSALERHFGALPHGDAMAILRNVGGLEIAAMAGMVLGAASHGIAVVCDGFISTAAAAVAVALEPRARGYLFAGHQSIEPGHRLLLEYLDVRPLLALEMRLGEGTGAVMAMSIVESAVALYLEMATFASAGVSEVAG